MHSTSILLYIMAMISNFTIFFYLSHIYFQNLLYKYNKFLYFHIIPAALLLTTSLFFRLNIFIVCSLKDSQNVFIQYLPLYKSFKFSMFLNGDIVDIENPTGICSLTFVVDEFSGLFLHLSIFSIKHSRSA